MATNVVALTQAGTADLETDIGNTLDARERVRRVIEALTAQRRAGIDGFLKTFVADLAAVKGDPDKGFVDAEFNKFVGIQKADEELARRIEAFNAIANGIEKRLEDFEANHADVMIALLERQIAKLEEERRKQEADEETLTKRIEALNDELSKLKPSATAKSTAAAKKTKK